MWLLLKTIPTGCQVIYKIWSCKTAHSALSCIIVSSWLSTAKLKTKVCSRNLPKTILTKLSKHLVWAPSQLGQYTRTGSSHCSKFSTGKAVSCISYCNAKSQTIHGWSRNFCMYSELWVESDNESLQQKNSFNCHFYDKWLLRSFRIS